MAQPYGHQLDTAPKHKNQACGCIGVQVRTLKSKRASLETGHLSNAAFNAVLSSRDRISSRMRELYTGVSGCGSDSCVVLKQDCQQRCECIQRNVRAPHAHTYTETVIIKRK